MYWRHQNLTLSLKVSKVLYFGYVGYTQPAYSSTSNFPQTPCNFANFTHKHHSKIHVNITAINNQMTSFNTIYPLEIGDVF